MKTRPLHEVVRQLYAARFNEKVAPVPLIVEFTAAGKKYRVRLENEHDAREIIGLLWLRSHHLKCQQRLKKRRETAAAKKAREFEEHLASASRTVKTWPKWKQALLGGKA